MSTGHAHPQVARTIAQQATRLMQIGNRFTNVPRIELGEKLAELAPPPLKRALFCSTGSEANETALRIAKKVTGRFEVIALDRGYHGRTLGAFSLSGASRRVRRGYGPMVPGAMAVPAPYELRCPFECRTCDLRCWSQSVDLIDRATTGEPAAFILEFVIGAGGVIPLPPEWVREVRRFCDERGVIMIADEALTGLGRTGTWFAFEHCGVVPDVVVMSKALGGGVPTAAILTSPELASAALDAGFMQTASHQGDPLQCAVALANIDVMEREKLLDNARQMGQVLATGLRRLVASYPIAGHASWDRSHTRPRNNHGAR
jgi:4-aminobutyrate aminotransferase-like enzyme